MKKKFLSLGIVACCFSMLFTACSDDNDSNPTYRTPAAGFHLNVPAYASETVSLEHSTDSLAFTWSQPEIGFPAAFKYIMQLSTTGTFNTELTTAEADASGETKADYMQIDRQVSTPDIKLSPYEVAYGLMRMEKWEENNLPTSVPVYARVLALYANDTVPSDTLTFNVEPYYIALTVAPPEIWYLVGGCVGDGSWSNNTGAIGTGLLPMYPVVDNTYDVTDGTGKIEFVGYFPADGIFKIVKTPGDWDHGFCGGTISSAGAEGQTYRNGGDDPGNITCSEEGVYKIVVDTKAVTMTAEKLDDVKTYSQLAVSGDFNSWGDTQMTPLDTYSGAQCHNWMYTLTGGVNLKFKIDGDTSWNPNWGSTAFPYGTGTLNGDNIWVEEGNWTVFFNDVTGYYYFVEQ